MDVTMRFSEVLRTAARRVFSFRLYGWAGEGMLIKRCLPRLIKARDALCRRPGGSALKIGPGPDTSFVLANFDPYFAAGRALDLGPPAR